MGTRLRLTVNILSNWGGLAFSTLVSFLLAPFILKKLGDDGYGVWMLCLSLTGYLGILDLGIRTGVVRFFAKFKASGDYRNLNQFVNTGLATYSLIGLAALAVGSILAIFSRHLFNIPVGLEGEATFLILAITLALASAFVTGVWASVLAGLERFDLLNLATTVGNFLRAVLIPTYFMLIPNLVSLGTIVLVSTLVGNLLVVCFAIKKEPALLLNLRLFSRNTFSTIFNYSLYTYMISIATRVAYYSANAIIGIFGTATEITYFSIGYIGIEFLRRVVYALTSVIMPHASGLDAQIDQKAISRLLSTATRYTLLLVLPASAVFLIMGKTMLSVWMGPEYADKSYTILLVLLPPQIYSFSQFAIEEILLGTSRHKFYAWICVAEALLNVSLCVILIKPLGIMGVAIGMAVPIVIFRILLSPLFVKLITKVPFWKYIKEAYTKPAAIWLPALLLAGMWEKFRPAHSLWEFVMQAVSVCALYFGLAWVWVLEEPVKRAILNRIRSFS